MACFFAFNRDGQVALTSSRDLAFGYRDVLLLAARGEPLKVKILRFFHEKSVFCLKTGFPQFFPQLRLFPRYVLGLLPFAKTFERESYSAV